MELTLPRAKMDTSSSTFKHLFDNDEKTLTLGSGSFGFNARETKKENLNKTHKIN